MGELLRGAHGAAHGGGLFHALHGLRRAYGAQHGEGHLGIGQQLVDGGGQIGADLLEALVALVSLYAAGRNQQVLRGGAHLAAVQRQ